ncbi:MAG: hypothetical protein HY951_13855 [Bacteroidia bacterium]|nr:hypothetical protein [Bacteroidia bacterium]
MKINILISVVIVFLLSSCAYLFNGIVFPNRCMKCEITDKFFNTVIWTDEGCGSEVTHMEDDAKIKAYDMNQGSIDNRYEVSCNTWNNPKE